MEYTACEGFQQPVCQWSWKSKGIALSEHNQDCIAADLSLPDLCVTWKATLVGKTFSLGCLRLRPHNLVSHHQSRRLISILIKGVRKCSSYLCLLYMPRIAVCKQPNVQHKQRRKFLFFISLVQYNARAILYPNEQTNVNISNNPLVFFLKSLSVSLCQLINDKALNKQTTEVAVVFTHIIVI